MPFIRFTRDRRGNETMLVLHAYRATSGAQRGRVLYLYHSPSHLKLGRQPLDAEVREALEHTHPDLVFDWPVLLRDSAASRAESRVPVRPQGRPPRAEAPRRSEPPPRPMATEDTPVARSLGDETAGRMRRLHRELIDRIMRRSRTPEDRDRLIAAAARLNPDDWSDEAARRAGAATFDADLAAIAAELPSRRRGRRGGRRGRSEPAGGPAGQGSDIIEESGEDHENAVPAGPADADGRADAGGDGGRDAERPEPAPDDPEKPAADV